jgi:predicted nucleic acid-binding protein
VSTKVFVDTDVILDMLLTREPHVEFAARLFSLAEEEKIDVFVSPLIFANLYYILRKVKSGRVAKEILRDLALLVSVVPIDEKTIELALSSAFSDLEDAIQYYAAIQHKIPCLITRNKKDFAHAEMLVCTASEFLNQMEHE